MRVVDKFFEQKLGTKNVSKQKVWTRVLNKSCNKKVVNNSINKNIDKSCEQRVENSHEEDIQPIAMSLVWTH